MCLLAAVVFGTFGWRAHLLNSWALHMQYDIASLRPALSCTVSSSLAILNLDNMEYRKKASDCV